MSAVLDRPEYKIAIETTRGKDIHNRLTNPCQEKCFPVNTERQPGKNFGETMLDRFNHVRGPRVKSFTLKSPIFLLLHRYVNGIANLSPHFEGQGNSQTWGRRGGDQHVHLI